ncbi:MAG: TonB-dependent receptor [Flavobacteriales bacterium]|nr:TonB-dependent receptor [Flavobacteriales bacterium]
MGRSALLLLILVCFKAVAQPPTELSRLIANDGEALLDQALDNDRRVVRADLAALGETDIRKAPVSITVLSAKHIKASGARNLLEALQLVPGITFGRDVDDVVGIAIHGTWAEEGKCLFMLNGMQLNENDFGTYAIGNRIPLDNVERIEVIAGPGSVLYGGYAALGVINIITRTARHATGGQVSILGSATAEGTAKSEVVVSGNNSLGLEQEVSYLASIHRGKRSNRRYTLPDGRSMDLADSTAGQAACFQFGYRWRTLRAHVYYMDDNYEVSDGGYSVRMRDVILGLEQRKKIGERASFGWKFSHADQIPWYYVNTIDDQRIGSNTSNVRTSLMGHGGYELAEWLDVRLGVQAYRQISTFFVRNGPLFVMNDGRTIAMHDIAFFAEVLSSGRFGDLSAGYRYEMNDLSGVFMAPRASYAKVAGRWHMKALASRAFKVPTIMNLNYGPEEGGITAEYANTLELETGIRTSDRDQFTANVYRTAIEDPIVYVFDAVSLDNYINRERAGTEGVDVRYTMDNDRFFMQLSYGIHRALANVSLPEVQLPAPWDDHFQGLPRQKATATLSVDLGPQWAIRSALTWNDRRSSYQYIDLEQETMELIHWPSEVILNAGLTWRSAGSGRWTMDVGCYNILDVDRNIVSPYNNGTVPLTLNGRELSAKLTYRLIEQ